MKLSKPLWFALIGTLLVAAYLLLTDGSPTTRPGSKKATSAKSGAKAGEYDKIDRLARFEPYKGGARNVFMPVVGRAAGLPGLGAKTDAIPALYASNEPDWIYTGTAEIDGVPVALFESTSTREGVFLKQGEHWKSSIVMQIGPDFVVVATDGGLTHKVSLPPYNMAMESGPLDVTVPAREATAPRVSITPNSTAPPISNGPENAHD